MNLALSVALLGGAIIDLDGTFFLQLGIFLAIFAMLNVLVFRPMLALMDARETATDGAKASARELETEAAEKLHAFETQMTAAKAELAIERERLRKDGQTLERDLISTARSDADGMLKEEPMVRERVLSAHDVFERCLTEEPDNERCLSGLKRANALLKPVLPNKSMKDALRPMPSLTNDLARSKDLLKKN